MDDLTGELRALHELPNAEERARRASRLVTDLQSAVGEASRIRREAVEELISAGQSQTQVAGLLGMTRARVGQLLTSGPRVDRRFLGTGKLTIALGGKAEHDKRGSGRVLAQEDMQAYDRLQALARDVGLETEYEVIEPPGMINLNRDNLVVVCGPRLSPLIAQVLESDTHIGFGRDNDGWYLADNTAQITYRSPMDSGENSDYAYLGRLPRLDGKGSFLYIAGIHAVGAPGVVHFLEKNMSELYSEAKTKRFSTVIRCDFDSATLNITGSARVGPIYFGES
ncbi:sigma-70 family RNA polymerase sigma factor [Pseudonocardia sp. N23]|uniref:sigma-70 family RNA polymerase sigma factor n=1 Tax=Pseudonocardia sp. N23 TaxID=1987376 RepID=UPI001C0F02AC|nr:sigma-70 family RNA polymerase sigma factor [Pseudonocardia sp. N23]